MKQFVCIAMFLAALLLPLGCAGTINSAPPAGIRTTPPGIDDVNVCHIFSPDVPPFASGTAVPIADGVLASCRHNFNPLMDALWIDGATRPISVFKSGSSGHVMLEDWVIFTAPPEIAKVSSTTVIDFNRPVTAGEDIYLIGFYGGPRHGISQDAARDLKKKIVHGKVVAPPALWTDCPAEIICVDAPEQDAYHGISGGAAVVYDYAEKQWVVVGIYRGMAIRKTEILGFERTEVSVHTVLRLTR